MPDDERRLADLLREPREDLDVEIKSWLDLNNNREHKAVLAKALIALANHGGGFVMLGLERTENGTYAEAAGRPENLAGYDQDSINGIVSRYAEPNFHCGLEIVEQPETGCQYPIITVPAGSVPVRSKRGGPEGHGITQNQYYIRRPGPASEPPQNAQEWDRLIRRCTLENRADLLESFRHILAGEAPVTASPAHEDTWGPLEVWVEESLRRWEDKRNALPIESGARCPLGHWWAAYQITEINTLVTPGELREIMAHERVRHTGWPPWPTRGGEGIPIVAQGEGIECWLGQNDPNERQPANADFWRATPQGLFFQLRGYQEDSGETEPDEPGQMLGLVIPIWRVAECLLHAQDMAARLTGEDVNVLFRTGWTGLRGRWLRAPQRMVLGFNARRWNADEDSITLKLSIESMRIRDNLAEIVWQLLRPLYQRFDFYELPRELVQHELELMLRHRFS